MPAFGWPRRQDPRCTPARKPAALRWESAPVYAAKWGLDTSSLTSALVKARNLAFYSNSEARLDPKQGTTGRIRYPQCH